MTYRRNIGRKEKGKVKKSRKAGEEDRKEKGDNSGKFAEIAGFCARF